MSRWLWAVAALVVAAGAAVGDLVFVDDFEGEPLVGSGNPAGWTIFGTPLDDRGTLHNSQYHSATAAVWVAFTWTGWGWGATTVSNETTRHDVYGDWATVGAWMRATNAFAAPSIAFTIFDADGTQWRTADFGLVQPDANWTHYETPLSSMVLEAAGAVAGLDYSNITHVGFLAFTGTQSGQNQLQFDDFAIESIPEPATVLTVAAGLLVLAFRRRRGSR